MTFLSDADVGIAPAQPAPQPRLLSDADMGITSPGAANDWIPVAQPAAQPDAQLTAQASGDFPVGPNGMTRVQIDVPKTTASPPATATDAAADDWQPVPGALTRAVAAVPAEAKDQPKDDQPKKASGIARNITAGLNEGIYTALGAPVDLARGAENLAIRGINYAAGTSIPTIPSDSFGGSQSIATGLGKVSPALDPANTTATTPGERIVRAAGQGASMMIAPEAAITGLGRVGVLAPEAVAAAAPYVGQSTGAGSLAANATVGAASGAGQGVAEEAAPNSPTAAIVGGLGGGLVGLGAASVPAVVRAGAGAARDFVAPLTQAGREQIAANQLKAAATDPAAAQAALENGPAVIVPGSQPTTFQQTGDMGLGALERAQAAKNPDQFAARTAEQNNARVTAAQGVQQAGAPEQVAASVRAYRDALDQQTQAALDAASQKQATAAGEAGSALSDQATGIGAASEGRLDAATQAAQGATAQIGLGQTPEAAGGAIRGSLEAARADAKQRERALWQAVDPDGTLALSPENTVAATKQLQAEHPASAAPIAGEESAIHNVVGQYGDAVPLQEMTALRSRLGTAMRQERLANGDSPAYRRLSILNSAISDDLDHAVAGRVAEDQQAVAAGTMKPQDAIAANFQRQFDAWKQAREDQAGGARAQSVGNATSARTANLLARYRGQGTPGIGLSNTPGNPRLSANAPNLDQAAADRLSAARQATAQRAATFDNKALGPMRARPSTNAPYNMPDATVAGKVFAPGKGGFQSVQTYRNAVGDPEALQALRDYAVDRLRNTALRPDGTLDPGKVAAFRKQYSDALRAFPDLDKQFGNAASASQTMAEVTAEHHATTSFLAKLQDFALRPDGSIDPARVDKFARDNADFIGQNPRLAKSLGDVQSATDAMANAAAQRKAALDDAQKGILGQLLHVDAPESVTNTVGGLFSRKDAVEQFTNLRAKIGNNPDAQEGLKKSIADYITKKFVGNTEAGTSGVGTMKSDGFQTFIKSNGAALRAAGFSNDQIATWKAIAADLQRSNRSASSVKLPGSNTAQDSRSILRRIVDASTSKIGGAAEGAVIGSHFGLTGMIVGGIGGTVLNSMRQAGLNSVDDIITDALLNPQRAKALLAKASGPKAPTNTLSNLANMYGRSAVATGVRYYDQHSKQFVPQEHVDAIKAAHAAVPAAAVDYLRQNARYPDIVRQFQHKYKLPAKAFGVH